MREILNLKGHPNRIAGSKVAAILLNGWILPFGGAPSGRFCAQPAKQACFNEVHPYVASRSILDDFGPSKPCSLGDIDVSGKLIT